MQVKYFLFKLLFIISGFLSRLNDSILYFNSFISLGKHKKNFFETLLRLTMDFVNSLIMDGAAVLESQGPAANRKISSSSFTFLVDIPESLSYLVNCIVDVRKFIGDIPEFYTIQKDADVIDGHGESATKNSDKLVGGRSQFYAIFNHFLTIDLTHELKCFCRPNGGPLENQLVC